MRQSTVATTTMEKARKKQEAERPPEASMTGGKIGAPAGEGETREESSDGAGSSSYSKSSTTN